MTFPRSGRASGPRGWGLALAVSGLLAACGGGGDPTPPANDGGGQSTTLSAAAQLGEKIFNDAALSVSGTQSCASCHVAASALVVEEGAQLNGSCRRLTN